jgi:hypothetical protein
VATANPDITLFQIRTDIKLKLSENKFLGLHDCEVFFILSKILHLQTNKIPYMIRVNKICVCKIRESGEIPETVAPL